MAKIELFLHIGMGKTGTSAIQNFLDINRKNLITQYNCLYPNFSSSTYDEGRCHNHAQWYRDFKNNDEGFVNEIRKLIIFAENHGINKIVLSYEGWIFQKELAARVHTISESFNNLEIKTISYLRRADQWFESAWKQWGYKQFDNHEDYLIKVNNLYQRILNSYEQWESIHGKENIIVRPYEKQQLPNGILYDFMAYLGIDYDSFLWEKNEETNLALNLGFDRDVLEVMRLSRELIPAIHDNHMADLFADLLGDKFQKKPFEGLSILSPTQRLELINENLPFEQKLAQKFMNREDGGIFYDPLPDPEESWQPYEGLTLEKFVPIVVQIVDSLDQKIEKQNQLIDRQDQMIREIDQRASEISLFSLIKKMKVFQPLKLFWRRLRKKV